MSRALTFWNLHRIAILMLLLSMGFYAVFAYDLQRSDSIKMLCLFGALFFLCHKLIQFEKWNYRFLVVAGVLLRLVFLVATPNLSQDFYRFLWDGQLLLNGFNPYLLSPDQWMEQGGPLIEKAAELHEGMGGLSARNFSNYPPVNQYFFAFGYWIGGGTLTGGIIGMRLLILLADLGVLYFGRKLLRRLNKAPHLIFWYFLNPLVIIELTGNLHFEGVMLFFFILALFLAKQYGWYWAAIPYALSIGVKLMPLMLLPLMLPLLGLRRSLGFYTLTAIALAACTYPLYFPEFTDHYFRTLKLWFSNFEFNAGLYGLAERIAVWQDARPWEFIKTYGRITPWITAATALLISLHPKMREARSWFTGALAVIAVYYLLAPVVHPWYLIFPLLVSLFTRFTFMILWSALVMLSYTAYTTSGVVEQGHWVLLEYIAVIGLVGYEIFKHRRDYFSFLKFSGTKSAN